MKIMSISAILLQAEQHLVKAWLLLSSFEFVQFEKLILIDTSTTMTILSFRTHFYSSYLNIPSTLYKERKLLAIIHQSSSTERKIADNGEKPTIDGLRKEYLVFSSHDRSNSSL